MSGKDHYTLGGFSFPYAAGGQPPPRAAEQTIDAYRLKQELWDNYRREAEHLVGPKKELALAANKAAVDVAQSALRTSVLVNAAGFVAIQAAVPLFDLRAATIQWPLVNTGVFFGGGLIAAWMSYAFAFHALAHAADEATLDAEATTYMLVGQHHPSDPRATAWTDDRIRLEKRVRWHRRWFKTLRMIGILLFWLSALLFLVGARRGVCTIVGALPSPPNSVAVWPMICRPLFH